MHTGKNFSLLFKTNDKQLNLALAPAYDLLSTVYYPEITPKMAMKFGNEYGPRKLEIKNIKAFASKIGLSSPAVCKRIVDFAKKIQSKLLDIAQQYSHIKDLLCA